MKTALITGVSGQDGAYLASFLIKKGYQVIGTVRSYRSINTRSLDLIKITDKIILEELPNWVWSVKDFLWEKAFNYLIEFKETNGHLQFPDKYVTDDGYKLGSWANTQRMLKHRMSKERIYRLN